MNSIYVCEYNNKPFFSLNIDATPYGLCLMELITNEFANLAKEALLSGDYDEAVANCRDAKDFQDAIKKAKDMMAEAEAESEAQDEGE